MLLSQLDSMQSQVISCLDLLLRWIVLRICDANTSCLLKVFELSKGLIAMMVSQVSPPTALSWQDLLDDQILLMRTGYWVSH